MNGKALSFFPFPVFTVYSFALSYAQHQFPDLVSMEHSTNGSRPPFMHSPGSFLSLCHLLLQYCPAIVSQVKHPCPLQYACAVRVLRLFLPYGHRSCLIQDPLIGRIFSRTATPPQGQILIRGMPFPLQTCLTAMLPAFLHRERNTVFLHMPFFLFSSQDIKS